MMDIDEIRRVLQTRETERLRQLKELDIDIERNMLGVSKKRMNKLKRLQHRVRSEIHKERRKIEEIREDMILAVRARMVEVGFVPSKPNCTACEGYGYYRPHFLRECTKCGGTGQQQEDRKS